MTSRKGWYVVNVADAARELDRCRSTRTKRRTRASPRSTGAPDGSAHLRDVGRARQVAARHRAASTSRRRQMTTLVQGQPALRRRPPVARRQHVRLHDVRRRSAGGVSMPPTPPSPQSSRLSDAEPLAGVERRCRSPSSSPIATSTARSCTACCAIRSTTRKGQHVPDGVRDLRDVLRQRLQRPRRVPRRTTATPSSIRR